MTHQAAMCVSPLLLVLLCIGVSALLDARLDSQWELWKKTHKKTYDSEVEEVYRRDLWEKKLHLITIHNLEASLGLHTYKQGINHLSDLTLEEVIERHTGFTPPPDLERGPPAFAEETLTIPSYVDWVEGGLVTSVKNQGSCGSCWAFSAVGSLEGQMAKATGTLVDLSPQNLVDCSSNSRYSNMGCKGGWMYAAFQYVINNRGLDSDASYPYVAKQQPCRYDPSNRAATCSSYTFVAQSEAALQRAVANIGPISVALHLESSFYSYDGDGVYYDPNCGTALNHAALVVGYGTLNGQDYWKVKNSWGPGWGKDGYILMSRNQKNQCAIATHALFPVVPGAGKGDKEEL